MSSKKSSTARRKSTGSGAGKRKTAAKNAAPLINPSIKREIGGWAIVLLLLLVTLGIYLKGAMGTVGVGLNTVFVGMFGFVAYVITLYSLVIGFLGLFGKLNRSLWVKLIFGYVILVLLASLLHVLNGSSLTSIRLMYHEASIRTGGLVGGMIGGALVEVIGKTGTIIVLVFLLLIAIILLTERSAVKGMLIAGRKTKEESIKVKQFAEERRARAQLRQEERRAYKQELAEAAASQEKSAQQTPSKEDTSKVKTKTAYLTLSEPTDRGDRQVKLNETEPKESAAEPRGASRFRRALKKVSEEPDVTVDNPTKSIVRYNDGAVDIPLIANDSYLERKRRFEEQTMEEAQRIVKVRGARDLDEMEPAQQETPAKQTSSASAKDPEKLSSKTAAKPSETEDDWSYLMNEAETASGKMESEPDPFDEKQYANVSTDKAFADEAFPSGYEERNETSERISKKSGEAAALPVMKKPGPTGKYVFPPISLLREGKPETGGATREELLRSAKSLEDVLMTFGVEAKVVQVNRGPAVTRYELQPKQGVKVSRIVNLTDDIAMNLAASSIRIEAPIPGKSAVGIEIPNKETSMVTLREVLDSDKFTKASSKVTFALGKDIDGEVQVADIARMPHMLIAGATGSGKSVCINSMIISILYKADPNDVKLILIDPKVVELSVYNGIPHLLLPVVNDPKQASATLNWAVQEMTRRFKKFAEMNVRDIKGYNSLIEETKDTSNQKMPQIVIIIDELADLMMTASKEVEASIVRLTQLARAAGMHLVIATQRPSVDVITGLIKANTPSRIAFAVSSGIDSRTILDGVGAENLLGKGDMLYAPFGSSKPIRIQGTFVSDKEVEDVVNFIKEHVGVAEYDAEMMNNVQRTGGDDGGIEDEIDEYLEDAIKFVVDKQKASISMLQRAFRIGFNRAARLMDALYARGIVGEDEGSKPRRVLMSKEEWENENS